MQHHIPKKSIKCELIQRVSSSCQNHLCLCFFRVQRAASLHHNLKQKERPFTRFNWHGDDLKVETKLILYSTKLYMVKWLTSVKKNCTLSLRPRKCLPASRLALARPSPSISNRNRWTLLSFSLRAPVCMFTEGFHDQLGARKMYHQTF
jgi:hypothetical protein